MNFSALQESVARWWQLHGPVSKPHDILMAIFNEMGALNAHCRRRPCKDEEDAVGAIVVLLAEYCNLKDISLQDTVVRVWESERQV